MSPRHLNQSSSTELMIPTQVVPMPTNSNPMVEGCAACPRALDPGSEFSNGNVKKITLELVEFYSPIPVGKSGSFFWHNLHVPNPPDSYVTVISSFAVNYDFVFTTIYTYQILLIPM